jgi:hypothetical protein
MLFVRFPSTYQAAASAFAPSTPLKAAPATWVKSAARAPVPSVRMEAFDAKSFAAAVPAAFMATNPAFAESSDVSCSCFFFFFLQVCSETLD